MQAFCFGACIRAGAPLPQRALAVWKTGLRVRYLFDCKKVVVRLATNIHVFIRFILKLNYSRFVSGMGRSIRTPALQSFPCTGSNFAKLSVSGLQLCRAFRARAAALQSFPRPGSSRAARSPCGLNPCKTWESSGRLPGQEIPGRLHDKAGMSVLNQY